MKFSEKILEKSKKSTQTVRPVLFSAMFCLSPSYYFLFLFLPSLTASMRYSWQL